MKAYVFEQGEHKIKDMDVAAPQGKEVVVNLKAYGLTRRDLYISNRLGKEAAALSIGSDGAVIIEAVGSEVEQVNVGYDVIINPALRWETKSVAPPASFDILGMPDHGTIAEKIVISQDQVEPKPEDLSWEEASVLAQAGLTGYRALVTKGEVTEGQTDRKSVV